jgi:hypothetical protein
MTNRLFVINDVSPTGDVTNGGDTFTPSYWPRYLYARPVAS